MTLASETDSHPAAVPPAAAAWALVKDPSLLILTPHQAPRLHQVTLTLFERWS